LTALRSTIVFIAAAGLIAALALSCVSGKENQAERFVPDASERCCHGNWRIWNIDDVDDGEGACGSLEEVFPGADSCWYRYFENVKIRSGEPLNLQVVVAVLDSRGDAQDWLLEYTPGRYEDAEYDEEAVLEIGHEARPWEYASDSTWGTEVALYRRNLAIVALVTEGTHIQRVTLLDSVDQAVREHLAESG
jgi:hypothetical protein